MKEIFHKCIILAILVFFIQPFETLGKNVRFDFALGSEVMRGYTEYQIGGKYSSPSGTKYNLRFPLSELKFPLNVFLVTGEAKISFFNNFILKTSVKKNINKKAGKLKDSDWGYWSLNKQPWANSSSLDIYSESDAKVDAFILNSDLMYVLFRTHPFIFNLGAGFLYEKFEYTASNVDQWYPSYKKYSDYLDKAYSKHYRLSGKVLTYDVSYYVPYIELAPEIALRNGLDITGKFGFSPYTLADDVDDHLVKYKRSEGSTTGVSYLVLLDGSYKFSSNLVFGLTLDYIFIMTKGTQEQTQYKSTDSVKAGKLGKIEEQLFSSQLSAGFHIGYRF